MNPREKQLRYPDETPQFLPPWVFIASLACGILGLAFWELRHPSAAHRAPDVYITEIGATGLNSVPDDEGQHSHWIEIGNFDDTEVSLEGWKLTDNFKHVGKWTFPKVTLAPGARLVVFASGKDHRSPDHPLHTNFKLDERGEYVALYMPDAQTVVHELLPKFPRQHGRETWGLREGLSLKGAGGKAPADAYRYFEIGTPGRPNAAELFGHVADIKASTRSSVLDAPFSLTLSCRTHGARIFYSTDGSLPDPTRSPRYENPIRVDGSTVIRAVAVREGWAASEVLTRSFLFPKSVLSQTGKDWPRTWGKRDGVDVTADYEMDPEIVQNGAYALDLLKGLRELPSVSLIVNPKDLFDTASGIYANPMETGRDWERPATFEYLPADGSPGARVDCGIRIQGGWNRRPEECPKHSLRVLFKREYGESKLSFPLFGRGKNAHFDTLILRGGCNNTWLHWSGEERARGDYIRDQWMRETSAAMGQPAAQGRFVHVYLNGLYWGLYNLCERPSAPFLTELKGGSNHDYDSRNAEKLLSGTDTTWKQLFETVNQGIGPQASLEVLKPLLNLTNFCDYMLLNFYGANADWDRSSNWYAARRNNPPSPYEFFIWDGERTLEDVNDNRMDFDDDLSPTRLFHKLEHNASFQVLFRERVRLHCGPGGALSPTAAAERFRTRASEIGNAIVAESARWGDYRRDVHPYKTGPYLLYTRDGSWKPEIQRLLNDYFPKRTAVLQQQLRQRGLAASTTP